MSNIGTINYAAETGLGIMTKNFIDNKIISDILIVPHKEKKNHFNWYPKSKIFNGNNFLKLGGGSLYYSKLEKEDLDIVTSFIKKIDILIIFETIFVKEIYDICMQENKKTILIPMWESTPEDMFFLEYHKILCPSFYDLQFLNSINHKINTKNIDMVTIPVNLDKIYPRIRNKIFKFIHNAGNLSFADRNGTQFIQKSLSENNNFFLNKLINKEISFDIRSQLPFPVSNKHINFVFGDLKFEDLWREGDCFVFPERFNGLSLPLQEAYASGMLILTSSRNTNFYWLDSPAFLNSFTIITKMPNGVYGEYVFDFNVQNFYNCLEKIINLTEKEIIEYSVKGIEWGEKNSFKAQKFKYLNEYFI